jgi:hypothetical protein
MSFLNHQKATKKNKLIFFVTTKKDLPIGTNGCSLQNAQNVLRFGKSLSSFGMILIIWEVLNERKKIELEGVTFSHFKNNCETLCYNRERFFPSWSLF